MAETKWAKRTEVEAASREWADSVLACRTLGHSWQQQNAIHVRRLRYWQVTYICDRGCGCVKYQEWNEQGLIYASWMLYPRHEDGTEAYLTEGIGRVSGETKGVLRIESVTRAGFQEQTGRASDEDIPRSQRTREQVMPNGKAPRAKKAT